MTNLNIFENLKKNVQTRYNLFFIQQQYIVMTNLNISKNIKKNVQTRFHGTHITCHINFKLLYEFSVTLILNYYISLEL